MAAMVLAPSLMLAGASAQSSEAFVLIALMAALFVLLEYAFASPGLIGFRAAPPFNRIRFLTLCAMLVLIALACSADEGGRVLSRLALAVGGLLGHAMDVPLSPVRTVLSLLPEGAAPEREQTVRAAAGLAAAVSIVALLTFAGLLRWRGWPAPTVAFNIWTNLPTFNPGRGVDPVRRLRRSGAVNISLGIMLPYLIPLPAVSVASAYGVSMLQSDPMLVWVMALWAFLPTSLVLRGIALRRFGSALAHKRRLLGEEDGVPDPGFLPV